ncbi:hypothetical protein EJ08DRAFT_693989 [Tothia fuscella]|uniref:Uncharacterized protein n=1 Tax=Tothia fuscella TaxID=1048955 RepID=A0A9P4U2H3_9PEZI|nr:hypothetical protein EJ08DRAFT_693989 [Tothia fuscella]
MSSLEDWINYDVYQFNNGWRVGYYSVDLSAKHVVMHGRRYGELVDFDADAAHRGDILGYPRAELAFEAQAYLMSVLRKVVDTILEGVSTEQPQSAEKWQTMVAKGFRHAGDAEQWSVYVYQPFSAPPVFSIGILLSLATTQLRSLDDHIYLLQTDLRYMRHYLHSIVLEESTLDHKLVKVENSVVNTLFLDIETRHRWQRITDQCERIRSIYERFTDNIFKGGPLPCK